MSAYRSGVRMARAVVGSVLGPGPRCPARWHRRPTAAVRGRSPAGGSGPQFPAPLEYACATAAGRSRRRSASRPPLRAVEPPVPQGPGRCPQGDGGTSPSSEAESKGGWAQGHLYDAGCGQSVAGRAVPRAPLVASPPRALKGTRRRCGQSCRWGGTGGRSGTLSGAPLLQRPPGTGGCGARSVPRTPDPLGSVPPPPPRHQHRSPARRQQRHRARCHVRRRGVPAGFREVGLRSGALGFDRGVRLLG